MDYRSECLPMVSLANEMHITSTELWVVDFLA